MTGGRRFGREQLIMMTRDDHLPYEGFTHDSDGIACLGANKALCTLPEFLNLFVHREHVRLKLTRDVQGLFTTNRVIASKAHDFRFHSVRALLSRVTASLTIVFIERSGSKIN